MKHVRHYVEGCKLYIDIDISCTGVEVNSDNFQRHVLCYHPDIMDVGCGCNELRPFLPAEILALKLPPTRRLALLSPRKTRM